MKHTHEIQCPACGGNKYLYVVQSDGKDGEIFVKVKCESCEGKGKIKLGEYNE